MPPFPTPCAPAQLAALPAAGTQFAEWSATGAFLVTAFRSAKPAEGQAPAKNVQVGAAAAAAARSRVLRGAAARGAQAREVLSASPHKASAASSQRPTAQPCTQSASLGPCPPTPPGPARCGTLPARHACWSSTRRASPRSRGRCCSGRATTAAAGTPSPTRCTSTGAPTASRVCAGGHRGAWRGRGAAGALVHAAARHGNDSSATPPPPPPRAASPPPPPRSLQEGAHQGGVQLRGRARHRQGAARGVCGRGQGPARGGVHRRRDRGGRRHAQPPQLLPRHGCARAAGAGRAGAATCCHEARAA
jgi:hypothetical protein